MPAKAIIDPDNVLGTDVDTIEQIVSFVNQLGGGPAVAALAAAAGTSAPTFATVTLSSGVAHVNAADVTETYYVAITGGEAGTVEVQLIDTQESPVTHTIVPATAADAVASQVIPVRVPAGWSIVVTTSVATIVASTVVTTGI